MATVAEARDNVIHAALRRATADYGDETNPHYDAQREYADTWLDTAAVELATVIAAAKEAKAKPCEAT